MKNFDLEKRSTDFAKEIVRLCRSIKNDSINSRIFSQLVGSSGSIGANYREANDSLGKKDFIMRLKISRKETKEVLHWLEILLEANPSVQNIIEKLMKEATELRNILSAIIIKSEKK